VGVEVRFFKVLLLMAFVIISAPGFSADYVDGVDAYQRGDFQAALLEWRPLAEQGDDRAQNNLGAMYRFGRGVARSRIEAVKWYRRSAELSKSQI